MPGPDWMDFVGQPELLRDIVMTQDKAELTSLVLRHLDYPQPFPVLSLPERERKLLTLTLLLVGAVWEDSQRDPTKWLRAADMLDARAAESAPKVPDGESRRMR